VCVCVCVWEDFLILAEEAESGWSVGVRCEESVHVRIG
jgi:hypothetical protein